MTPTFDPNRMTFLVIDEDDDGNETTHTVPAHYEVCDRCEGRGRHDHPAFANGITRAEFDEDPDFEDAYFSGRYDVTCEDCKGLRVVPVVDEDDTSEGARVLRRQVSDDLDYRREREHERRMGY